MKCKKCKKIINKNDKYCPFCGEEIQTNINAQKNDSKLKISINRRKIVFLIVCICLILGLFALKSRVELTNKLENLDKEEYKLQDNGMYRAILDKSDYRKDGDDLLYKMGSLYDCYYQNYFSNGNETQIKVVIKSLNDDTNTNVSEENYNIIYEDNKISRIETDGNLYGFHKRSTKSFYYDGESGNLTRLEELISIDDSSSYIGSDFSYYTINGRELIVEKIVKSSKNSTENITCAYFQDDILDNNLYQELGINTYADDSFMNVYFGPYGLGNEEISNRYIVNKYQYFKKESISNDYISEWDTYSYKEEYQEFKLYEDENRNITGFSFIDDNSSDYSNDDVDEVLGKSDETSIIKNVYREDSNMQYIYSKGEEAAKKVYSAKYKDSKKGSSKESFDEFYKNNKDWVLVEDISGSEDSIIRKTVSLKKDDEVIKNIEDVVIDYSIFDQIYDAVENIYNDADMDNSNIDSNVPSDVYVLISDFLSQENIDPNSYTIVFGSTEGEENIYQVIGKEDGTIGWYAVNIKTGAVRKYSMVDVG